jgi:hypothetical protein
MGIEQKELWDLMPGAAGGRELARLKGREYFVELGKQGGATTRDRYGTEYLKALAQRGGEANRKRYHTQPRTIHPWYGGTERSIPYWPPRSTKRRKRPVYIRIEMEHEEQDA